MGGERKKSIPNSEPVDIPNAHSENEKEPDISQKFWNFADNVSNFVWNLVSPPKDGQTEGEAMPAHSLGSLGENHPPSHEDILDVGTEGRRSSTGSTSSVHHRSFSTPEKLARFAYLDLADYGIKMKGRTVKGEDALLTQDMLNKIHGGLPARYRLSTTWKLIYSTPEHGFSLSTLFFQCREHEGPTLMVIRDDGDAIFGVFATETWIPHFGHYGTGECFLWRVESDGRIRKFASTGKNDYFMISETEYLAAGCGDAHFGLWLDAELFNGLSQSVPTFENECLASAERFKCVNMEVWGLDMNHMD